MKNDSSVGPPLYRLTIKEIHEETRDAKSFVLCPPEGLETIFSYVPGQFLTFHVQIGGAALIRSYSLSSAPGLDQDMRICVKEVKGGRVSKWFNNNLRVGAQVEATLPTGRFILRKSKGPVFLIAGGSGITPCISLIKHALIKTDRKVKLLYANRDKESAIYRSELEKLHQAFLERFECEYWLDDRQGFLTPQNIASFSRDWIGADIYICGPSPLMDMAEDTLVDYFGEQAFIRTERFLSPVDDTQELGLIADHQRGFIETFRLTLDGEDHTVPYSAGTTLLQAALHAGIAAPHSCTEGHCGTCIGALRSGKVEMQTTKALSKRNLERGHILACQAYPVASEALWLDLDL